MKQAHNRKQRNKQTRRQANLFAFNTVYGQYQEAKSVSGTMTCSKFYKRLANLGNASNGRVGLVVVSIEDFIADVELTAMRYLTSVEFKEFKAGRVEERLQEILGKVFRIRKIHPMHKYLRPKAVQRAKA